MGRDSRLFFVTSGSSSRRAELTFLSSPRAASVGICRSLCRSSAIANGSLATLSSSTRQVAMFARTMGALETYVWSSMAISMITLSGLAPRLHPSSTSARSSYCVSRMMLSCSAVSLGMARVSTFSGSSGRRLPTSARSSSPPRLVGVWEPCRFGSSTWSSSSTLPCHSDVYSRWYRWISLRSRPAPNQLELMRAALEPTPYRLYQASSAMWPYMMSSKSIMMGSPTMSSSLNVSASKMLTRSCCPEHGQSTGIQYSEFHTG